MLILEIPHDPDGNPQCRLLKTLEMKPVAYLHILDNTEGIEGNNPDKRLSFSSDHPFGEPGMDFCEEFTVRSIPLYSLMSMDSELEPDGRNKQASSDPGREGRSGSIP